LRRAALLIVALDLAVIADVGSRSAERIRRFSRVNMDDVVQQHVGEWADFTYGAVWLGLVALIWAAVGADPRVSWLGRIVRRTAHDGTFGALFCGIALAVCLKVWTLANGDVTADMRTYCEVAWLLGTWLGGLAGMAIGCGLAIVNIILTRPSTKRGAIDVPAGEGEGT
jgi:hypothetical protein